MSGLGYSETDERLAVRIRAHTAFANVQLEGWLKARINAPRDGRILDVGCGDGNLFPVYAEAVGPGGLVVGFDVSDSLLRAARQRIQETAVPAAVFKCTFDQPFPLRDGGFDATVSAFAAYYARDAAAWTDEVLRVTRRGGQVLVLGPTDDNAEELYALNERVTGIGHTSETAFTTSRLEREFLPSLRERVGRRVTSEVLDRRIEFPSAEEFARYYQATWLYEKSCQKVGRTFSRREIEDRVESHTLSKRVLVIEAPA